MNYQLPTQAVQKLKFPESFYAAWIGTRRATFGFIAEKLPLKFRFLEAAIRH
jgi:hypothetical protein